MTKYITSLDEDIEVGVKYTHPDFPDRWFKICEGDEGFGLNANLGLYNFFTVGNRVRIWKTLKGVIRFMKRQSAEGYYYFVHWADPVELEKLETRKQKEAQRRADRRNELDRRRAHQISALKSLAHSLRDKGFSVWIENGTIYLDYEGDTFKIVFYKN